MQVFRLHFKLLKKSFSSIMIYLVVFLVIVVGSSLNAKQNSEKIFKESKVDIAFINYDKDSALLNGLKEYLGSSCDFKEIGNSKEAIQDALFFRSVVYIITIPKDFTDQFLKGEVATVQKLSVPESTDSVFIDMAINNYFNKVKLYMNHTKNLSKDEIVKSVMRDLSGEVEVDIYSNAAKEKDNSLLVNYYNYIVYAMLSTLILGIGSIMISFTKIDIKRRNLVTPVSITSINLQQILGNITFAIGFDIILILLGFLLNGKITLDQISLLFILNLLVFSVAALSIAYLVGILVKSREASNGIANIIGMGSCFISGIFVPREFLGDSVLNVAKFTPTYWYTTNNDLIGKLTNYTIENFSMIFENMLIQLGFAIAIFAISLVISKKKSLEVI